MKKIALLIFAAASWMGCTSQTVVDSYDETHQNSVATLYAGTNIYAGQSFTVTEECVLAGAQFYIYRTGSVSADVTVYVYAHSGTYGTSSVPTGSPLATSDVINFSTLPTSIEMIDFTFSGANNITLSAGTYYCVAVKFNSGDASNNLKVGIDISGQGHSGNRFRSINGSTWVAASTAETIFVVTSIATGYPHKVCGITASSISKISGVEATSIQKVQGVSK